MSRSTVAWPRLTIRYEMTYTQLHQGINWIYFGFSARDQIQDCQGIMALERNLCILVSPIMRKVAVLHSSVWLQTLNLLCQEGSSVIYKYYRIPLLEFLFYCAPFIYFLFWPVFSSFLHKIHYIRHNWERIFACRPVRTFYIQNDLTNLVFGIHNNIYLTNLSVQKVSSKATRIDIREDMS